MPAHHPSSDLLCAVAAGQQTSAVQKIVLAHVSMCGSCRTELDRLETLGGAMLDEEGGVALTAGALERALAAIAALQSESAPPAAPAWLQSVPLVVRDLAAEVALGSAHVASKGAPTLNLMQTLAGNGETMELLRIEPGKAIPAHAHGGMEYTLVLTGAFHDQRGLFTQGDLAVSGVRHAHRPVAEQGEICVALIVTTAPLRFKGPLGLLQRMMTLGRG